VAELIIRGRHLAALEKIFAAEIYDRLPLQSKAKIYRELADAGYVVEDERIFGHGPFAVHCRGWFLTQLGRLTYCVSCSEVAENG
jgi:hypothetical protein